MFVFSVELRVELSERALLIALLIDRRVLVDLARRLART